MKSWLSKWKISAALDSGQPLPESLRRKIDADPELQRFAQRAQALGQTLRSPPPSGPPDFHDSIMRAVRSSARAEQPRRVPVWSWLAASGAVAAVAVACLYLSSLRPKVERREALDGPVKILKMGENISTTVPSFAMSPLSNEWAHVDHDLQDTAQVLLASLP
jgi:hypothetical protein